MTITSYLKKLYDATFSGLYFLLLRFKQNKHVKHWSVCSKSYIDPIPTFRSKFHLL